MELSQRQAEVKTKIEFIARLFEVDPVLAKAVAMTESSLGEDLISPTGCSGIFQMSTIAMKDLLLYMRQKKGDLVGITSGIGFLQLLIDRHGSAENAVKHYCDPDDRGFYWDRVRYFMREI